MTALESLQAAWGADKWDTDAALRLVDAAADMPYADADPIFTSVTAVFPTAARVWRAWGAAAERATGDVDAKAVYETGVAACSVDVPLWRAYARLGGAAVFERAVAAAGGALEAEGLWWDWLAVVRKGGARAEERKVLQRAVATPMRGVDGFWTEYRSFEESADGNKELGRGLLAEAQPKYVAARAEFRGRRIRKEGLAGEAWAVPARGRPKEAQQAREWAKFLDAEKRNLHGLSKADLYRRVVHAYECALVPLYRYPNVWIEFLSFVADAVNGKGLVGGGAGKGKGGGGGGGRGGVGNKTEVVEEELRLSWDDFEAVADRAVEAVPECVAVFTHISWLWMRATKSAKALAVLDVLAKKNPSPLAFIHLMRLTRKVSGKDAARKVFAKARKSGAHSSVYVAAAQMEFLVNKDNKIARNVFEFGLKTFASDALMVHEFVEWLWGLGDFDHLRVVLKRVMPDINGPPTIVRALWERWIELEDAIGDVASVDAVEQLWTDKGSVGRVDDVVCDAVRRCRYLCHDGMGDDEIAVLAGPPVPIVAVSSVNIGGGSGGGAIGSSGSAPMTAMASAGGSGGGGGRRDPRTGKIVGRARANGANGTTTPAVGNVPGGGSGGPNGRLSGEDVAGITSQVESALTPGNNFEEIASNVQLMASGMQTIMAPPPDYDSLVQLIVATPDTFEMTPVGSRTQGLGPPGLPPGLAKGVSDKMMVAGNINSSSGKKRGSEMIGQTPDLFSTRQAAKQSRMR